MEGPRPILVELQALVSRSFLAVPRRTTIGVDHNRVALLVAVLEKKMGAKLFDQDIFVNVAGGVQVDEPAVDLGRSEEHTSELQSRLHLVCRLLLEKKKNHTHRRTTRHRI